MDHVVLARVRRDDLDHQHAAPAEEPSGAAGPLMGSGLLLRPTKTAISGAWLPTPTTAQFVSRSCDTNVCSKETAGASVRRRHQVDTVRVMLDVLGNDVALLGMKDVFQRQRHPPARR